LQAADPNGARDTDNTAEVGEANFSVTQGNAHELLVTFNYILRGDAGGMLHVGDKNITIQIKFTVK